MLEEYMTQLCVRYGNQPNVRWMDVVNETIAKENVNDPVFGPQKRGEWFAARQGTDKWEIHGQSSDMMRQATSARLCI